MKPLLYMGRHGQTDYNLRDCLLGHLDAPLIPAGIVHAQNLAAWFADKGIARVYSSPLKRAVQTAELIAQKSGVELIIDPLLIEVDYGDIDGMPIKEAKAKGIYGERDRDRMNFRPPNGETYAELYSRIGKFFEKEPLLQAERPSVIISHQGTARMITAWLKAMSLEDAAARSIGHETVLTAWRGNNNEIETSIEDILTHERIYFRPGRPVQAMGTVL